MQLLILVLIAGVVGYFLSRSRFSKPIDDTADKVADVSRGAADTVEGWGRNLFRRKAPRSEQVIEGTAVDAEPETPPAEKQYSRRHASEADLGTKIE
jgi:hypothetical protein